MKRTRRRNAFFLTIVTSIIFVVSISNWRASGARTSLSAFGRDSESSERSARALRSGMPAFRPAPTLPPTLQQFANFPLAFEANLGQADQRIRFLGREAGGELQLSDNSVTLRSKRFALSFHFKGANGTPRVVGEEPLAERRNFLLGNDRSKWHTDVPTFRRVAYEQLYSGIDLTFYGNQKQIEYDFEVGPGADPRAIRLSFDRNARAQVSDCGDLVLKSKDVELIQRKPIFYQTIAGKRRVIDGKYYLLSNREVGFEVGDYDHAKPLVIDPTLIYSTFLGGGGDDSGSSIAVDTSGNVYVAGTTASTNFPTRTPAFVTNKGLSDIFVTKIDSAGANIIYSTYIGGSGLDRAAAIAIDSSGNAYAVGRVGDTSTDFPTTAGSLAPTYRG